MTFPQPAVILVDDDPAVRHSLAFVLGLEGYQVRTFATAGAMLAMDTVPDRSCLIIDYALPDLNGLELLAKLRTMGVSHPAILITSNPTPALRRRAAAALVPIVEKPLLSSSLTDAIRAAMGGGRSSEQEAIPDP